MHGTLKHKFLAAARRGHLHELRLSVVLGAFILLLSAISLLATNYAQLRKSNEAVRRTNLALREIAEVDAKLVGVEMTVRGYALTNDPLFITAQKYEREHLATAMGILAQAISSEPTQQARFAAIRELIAQRLALYARLFALGPGHARAVADAITNMPKRKEMLAARLTLTDLREHELALLDARQADLERDALHAFLLAVVLVVISFLFGAVGLTLSQRPYAREA